MLKSVKILNYRRVQVWKRVRDLKNLRKCNFRHCVGGLLEI